VSFLLDTNVVSEWTKPRPNAGIVEWLARVDEDEVFLSVVTFAELRCGIERLPMEAGAGGSMNGCAASYRYGSKRESSQ
jgi:predicted nucleic acid-binding protein